MEITKDQYNRYESVRRSGVANMFSKEAQILTCLDNDTYFYIIEHFAELQDMYGVDKKSAEV